MTSSLLYELLSASLPVLTPETRLSTLPKGFALQREFVVGYRSHFGVDPSRVGEKGYDAKIAEKIGSWKNFRVWMEVHGSDTYSSLRDRLFSKLDPALALVLKTRIPADGFALSFTAENGVTPDWYEWNPTPFVETLHRATVRRPRERTLFDCFSAHPKRCLKTISFDFYGSPPDPNPAPRKKI